MSWRLPSHGIPGIVNIWQHPLNTMTVTFKMSRQVSPLLRSLVTWCSSILRVWQCDASNSCDHEYIFSHCIGGVVCVFLGKGKLLYCAANPHPLPKWQEHGLISPMWQTHNKKGIDTSVETSKIMFSLVFHQYSISPIFHQCLISPMWQTPNEKRIDTKVETSKLFIK